jgi:SMI1 / KNR4 family (SUKH-1)
MIGMAPFAQVEASFWDTTVEYGVFSPLTSDMVAAGERELGVKLPSALLRLLGIQNGGSVAQAWNACLAEPNFYAEDHVPFEDVFGIGAADDARGTTMLDTRYLVQEWGLPTPVVLLSGDGHHWIALDYRVFGPDGEPAVAWIDNEMDHELRLAPDFRTFVEGLTSSDRYPD